MPEFIIPAEADHCFYCGKVLYDPPNCCDEAQTDYAARHFDEYENEKPYYLDN